MRVQIIDDKIVAWGVAIFGDGTYDGAPDDYSPERYFYTPIVAGVFSVANFILKPQVESIDFEGRLQKVRDINAFMVTELNDIQYRSWLADTATLQVQFEQGSDSLIAFMNTINDVNWGNYSTTGFKTKTSYRGNSTNGLSGASGNYPRANSILAILTA